MSSKDTSQHIIDTVLRELVTAGALGAGLVLPNLLKTIDKPLARYLKHLDHNARQREARRVVYYMKAQGLIAGQYDFGLGITPKGRKALEKLQIETIEIPKQKQWDKKWRIVFYDIPEKHKHGRDTLTSKLRSIGFFQLQRSVWIHPLPCREVIEKITSTYGIEKYVSYVEANHLDNQKLLIDRFSKRLTTTRFS